MAIIVYPHAEDPPPGVVTAEEPELRRTCEADQLHPFLTFTLDAGATSSPRWDLYKHSDRLYWGRKVVV